MQSILKLEHRIAGVINEENAASRDERILLYSLVRAVRPEVVVEIGTHKGLTALYIASALADNGKGILHTTDPYDHKQEDNIGRFSELSQFIKIHRVKGEELDVDKVDFLFVDGYHEEEFVVAEMEHFLPRLTDKAIVIFHDCGGDNMFVGVNSAIEKLGLYAAFLPTDNQMRIYGNFNPDSNNPPSGAGDHTEMSKRANIS